MKHKKENARYESMPIALVITIIKIINIKENNN